MADHKSANASTRTSARRGRPPIHREAWTKVSVVMFERQVVQLDRLTARIKSKTGATLTRAEVIRALLDALTDSRLDVTLAASGKHLKHLLTVKLSA